MATEKKRERERQIKERNDERHRTNYTRKRGRGKQNRKTGRKRVEKNDSALVKGYGERNTVIGEHFTLSASGTKCQKATNKSL